MPTQSAEASGQPDEKDYVTEIDFKILMSIIEKDHPGWPMQGWDDRAKELGLSAATTK